MSETRIGILGTGRMGTAIARRLVETGHAVSVWNRTPGRVAEAAKAGATPAATLAELVDNADVLISSLTDFDALWQVYGGADGVLANDIAGRLCIEMSTILPDEQQKLAQAVRGHGADYVECPVGGTVAPALKGQLLGFAGGDTKDWDRARPILEQLCKRVELLGDIGAGSSMKLAVNLPLAIYWNVLGESLNLLSGLGLNGRQIASLMADSSAGPNVLKNRMDVVADTIDGHDQPGTFDIDGLRKDLALSLEWAERNGKRMPVSAQVSQTYAAAVEAGLGGFDGASLARFVAGST